MKTLQVLATAMVCAVLSACDSGGLQSKFNVESDDVLVKQVLPEIRQACPGLDKYSGQFESVRVEHNYRTTIAFDIPDAARLPDGYKADGHTCFLEVDDDGSLLLIEKAACKSVCLDQTDVPEGQMKLLLGDSP